MARDEMSTFGHDDPLGICESSRAEVGHGDIGEEVRLPHRTRRIGGQRADEVRARERDAEGSR